jgi:TolB-like protein
LPDPHSRYPDARDFGDTLAAALAATAGGSLDRILTPTAPSTQTDSFAAKNAFAPVRRRRLWLAASLLAVVLAAGLLWLFSARFPKSVAVLPFENRTGEPEYLVDGITESLTNDLACIPSLRVSAHGSVERYEGAKPDPLKAGRELNVDRVVRGSVARSAGELRIEVELIDVRSGARIWGHTRVTQMASLSGALEQFSTEVIDQLRLKLSGPEKVRLARQYATGSESYQDYLKGRFQLNKRTAQGFETAVGHFQDAIVKNAEYAPAHAGLAYTYAQLALHASVFGSVAPVQVLEQARTAAQKALKLDSTLSEAYTALAFVQMQADHDWGAAEKTYLRAIEYNHSWADAHECYALELAALGRFDEALRQAMLAEKLDPSSWGLRAAHATILYYGRRHDESLALLDVIAKDPRSYGKLGDVIAPNYWAKSMPAEALQAVEQLPANFTPHLRTPLLICAYARANRRENARALLAGYTVKPETAVWYYLAAAHLDLGDKTDALRDLERDYDRRSAEILFVAVDSMMDSLRADPRFRALLARMKLN